MTFYGKNGKCLYNPMYIPREDPEARLRKKRSQEEDEEEEEANGNRGHWLKGDPGPLI